MPTNQNVYNSRVTDEALEKRFRDTFTSQGGSELVSDLYAQGVIVPIVDFTAAATGDTLAQNLQTAWDFSTGYNLVSNTATTIINTPGFWQCDLTCGIYAITVTNTIFITDGLTNKTIWAASSSSGTQGPGIFFEDRFVVFLRAGDSLVVDSNSANAPIDIWYRQIADVSGNLVQPSGFTSS